MVEGGRLVTAKFQLLMLSPNLLKFQIPYVHGGGGGVGDGQLPTFDAESKSAKISNSLCGGGGGVGDGQLPTFDAECKSAKIPNSLCGYWEGGVKNPTSNF